MKYNRWWRNYPNGLLPYVNAGITYEVWLRDDEQYTRDSNRYGAWLFGGGNEPNLHGTTPEEYVETIKKGYKVIKDVSPENMLAAPVIHSIQAADWLRGFYEAGGKDYFDTMDVHIYQQTSLPVPEGLPPGSPEGVLLQIAEIKKIMAEYGDEDKPLITTEMGYPTYNGRSWAVRGDDPGTAGELPRPHAFAYDCQRPAPYFLICAAGRRNRFHEHGAQLRDHRLLWQTKGFVLRLQDHDKPAWGNSLRRCT